MMDEYPHVVLRFRKCRTGVCSRTDGRNVYPGDEWKQTGVRMPQVGEKWHVALIDKDTAIFAVPLEQGPIQEEEEFEMDVEHGNEILVWMARGRVTGADRRLLREDGDEALARILRDTP